MIKPIIYQLLPRLFSNLNDACIPSGTIGQNGSGKFNEIDNRALQGIRSLGVTHLWLTGIIEHATSTDYSAYGIVPDNHHVVKGKAGSPYAIKDYYDVDPDLAVDVDHRLQEFDALVGRIHDQGMKVIIDFVPNHVARQYHSDAAPSDVTDFGATDDTALYFGCNNNFYYIPRQLFAPSVDMGIGKEAYVEFPAKASGNDCFTAFPGVNDWYDTVKLNYGYNFMAGLPALRLLPGWTSPKQHVPKTWRIMDDILSFWQSLGIGGFRCDMAQMIPMAFWKWAISRSRVRLPDVFFMAEAYNDHMKTTPGDPCAALLDAGFNAVYDSDCYHLALHMYTENNWANDFDRLFRSNPIYMTHGVRYVENHDETRVCSPLSWGGVGRVVLPAVMTLVYASGSGPVLVYNGQEVGERAEGPGGFGGHDGRTSIFDYTCLPRLQPWVADGRFDSSLLPEESAELRNFHRKLLPLMQHPALDRGDFYGLNWANMKNTTFGREPAEDTSGHWVYAMLRHDARARATVLVVGNLSPNINFYNLRISIPQHAFGWCGIQTDRVRVRNLMDAEGEDRIFERRELMDCGLSHPLKPGHVGVLELSAV